MNRRHFLKNAGLAAGALACTHPLKALAQATGKTLIVIFQRGGCDGLSALVPHGDDEYYRRRPSIAVPRPGRTNGALDIDGYFGLHPQLAGLMRLYDQGHLGWVPSVQYPDPNHSHFESMEFIEQAVPNAQLSSGWLNRYMTDSTGNGLRGATFDSELDKAMRGEAGVVTINDLSRFNLDIGGVEEAELVDELRAIYSADPSPGSAYRRLTHGSGQLALEYLKTVQSIDTENYTPENSAVYPERSFGRHLSQIAQLIKAEVGLEIATTSVGGWDTHENQGGADPGGSISESLRTLADGIEALYTDLGPQRMRNTLILTMTEFGRTVEENGSGGTDHGEGSVWFAVSGSPEFVPGAHGEWPGLASEQLSNERYLRWTVDYRDIMGDVLRGHLGAQALGAALPGHTHTPVGLFSGLG